MPQPVSAIMHSKASHFTEDSSNNIHDDDDDDDDDNGNGNSNSSAHSWLNSFKKFCSGLVC
jgi:hypothetical protein